MQDISPIPIPKMINLGAQKGRLSSTAGLSEPQPEKTAALDVEPAAATPGPVLHHLTRHWLAPSSRGGSAIDRLGASDSRSAEQMIRNMGQRELRTSFQKVYGSATNSFNNNWLRRKLYEGM